MRAYDRRTQQAVTALLDQVQADSTAIAVLQSIVSTGQQAAQQWWDRAAAGEAAPSEVEDAEMRQAHTAVAIQKSCATSWMTKG